RLPGTARGATPACARAGDGIAIAASAPGWGDSVEAQVLDRAAAAADELERVDADADVVFDEIGGDLGVAGFGLDAFRDHRLVGDQQQRAGRDRIGEAGGEDGGRFHVD